jgi:hypothetical protein
MSILWPCTHALMHADVIMQRSGISPVFCRDASANRFRNNESLCLERKAVPILDQHGCVSSARATALPHTTPQQARTATAVYSYRDFSQQRRNHTAQNNWRTPPTTPHSCHSSTHGAANNKESTRGESWHCPCGGQPKPQTSPLTPRGGQK